MGKFFKIIFWNYNYFAKTFQKMRCFFFFNHSLKLILIIIILLLWSIIVIKWCRFILQCMRVCYLFLRYCVNNFFPGWKIEYYFARLVCPNRDAFPSWPVRRAKSATNFFSLLIMIMMMVVMMLLRLRLRFSDASVVKNLFHLDI